MLHPILAHVKSLGHAVFTTGVFNLNIIGVRKSQGTPNAFDDHLHVLYRDTSGQWVNKWWPITTDPGLYYMMSKDRQLNPAGTAILAPGQYRGVYKVSRHGKSRYEALCQRNGSVRVFRDGNHDDQHDHVNPQSGSSLGINIHAASSSPYKRDQVKDAVGVWSAGCQVFAETKHFRSFMQTVRAQTKHNPTWDTFTYTLVTEF